MIEDQHTIFEWLIHTMELSVVIGIAVTIWYIKTHSRKNKNEGDLQHRRDSDPRSGDH